MARQLLTVVSVNSSGLLFKAGTPTLELPGAFVPVDQMTDDEIPVPVYADGQSFMNDGDMRTFIAVDNSEGAVDTTLTIETYETVEGLAVADRAVVIAAGDMVLVRPGPARTYNQPSGLIYFSLSEVTDVTVAVVKV